MKSLQQIFPTGIRLSGIAKVKVDYYGSELKVALGEAKRQEWETLIQRFALATAQEALSFPEKSVLDKTAERIPGAYLMRRPQAVTDILDELATFYETNRKSHFLMRHITPEEFRSIIDAVETYSWRIAFTARQLEV